MYFIYTQNRRFVQIMSSKKCRHGRYRNQDGHELWETAGVTFRLAKNCRTSGRSRSRIQVGQGLWDMAGIVLRVIRTCQNTEMAAIQASHSLSPTSPVTTTTCLSSSSSTTLNIKCSMLVNKTFIRSSMFIRLIVLSHECDFRSNNRLGNCGDFLWKSGRLSARFSARLHSMQYAITDVQRLTNLHLLNQMSLTPICCVCCRAHLIVRESLGASGRRLPHNGTCFPHVENTRVY